MTFSAAVLTISDAGAAGTREDTSGPAIREMLESLGIEIAQFEVIPDSREQIESRLMEWSDAGQVALIVTTGGTGLGPRDTTPEATKAVLDYEVPGMAEAMRVNGLRYTPMSMLSRAIVGVRKTTLIVNLPGSPKAVRENLDALIPVLTHALELLAGERSDHGR